MITAAAAIVAFLSGTTVEALFVLWVHYAERNSHLRLFIIGLLLGTANVLGLGALQTSLNAAAFILGYAVGSIVGLEVKKFIEVKRV